ncbi:MAG: hypothetical protein K0S47_1303 [Herbinix sp.]|jgi:hypothetical protein|nr:hypothetical protein [Herbinix sp.]
MSLNSYKEEAKDFMQKLDACNKETRLKLSWLDKEFQLLKEAVELEENEKIRHQIYDMLFLLFEIAADYDYDLDTEWSNGRKKKEEKYLSGKSI